MWLSKCCVHGCKSICKVMTKESKERLKSKANLPHEPTFSFPKDETLRAAWFRKIPNKHLKVTNNSRVCIKQFHAKDVILYCNICLFRKHSPYKSLQIIDII